MKKLKQDYSYGWEKLHCAVLCLSGSGEQRTRLISALFALHTLVIRPEEKHLPDEIQREFNEFWKEMTSVQAVEDEGTIQATVNSMDEMGIRRAVEKIIYFYDTIYRYIERY